MNCGNSELRSGRLYSSIDISKYFFCICIIALHTHLLSFLPTFQYYIIEKNLFRLAVPFFFISSGYFLASKWYKYDGGFYVIKRYCKRLMLPLLVFSFVYISQYAVYSFFYNGKSMMHIALALARNIIFYPMGALWFVQACIVGSLLLYPFLKKNRLSLAIACGFILYAIGQLFNSYSFIISEWEERDVVLFFCKSLRNGFTMGLLWLALGFKCYQINKKKPNRNVLITTLIVGLILQFIETIAIFYASGNNLADDGSLFLSQLIVVPSMLLLLLQTKIDINEETSLRLRNLSTGMYFLHTPLRFMYDFFISNDIILFFVVFMSAYSICVFSYKTVFLHFDRLLR